jgi:AcrR family transcriptional regulator
VLRAQEAAVKPAVEETRSKILAAVRELYTSKGSRGTTTREVADLAGVNEATVFRHFGTKGQLLAAMLDHYSTFEELPRMLERVRAHPTVEKQLQALALESIELMKRKEDLIKVSMAEELTNPDGLTCAWRGPSEARSMIAGYFAEKTASGQLRGEPQILARVFMSLFFSYVMARRIWADLNVPKERAVETMVELFVNGARAN